MSTFIKAKLKKSDDQTNIDKYRIAANIAISYYVKIIFLKIIIILKFIMIRQLFHMKNLRYNIKIVTCLKWTYRLFGQNLKVAKLSTFYLNYQESSS